MKIKTLLPLFIVHDQHFKEYFRIMRVSLFMLFVCIFQLMATNTEAQNAIMKLETNVISIGQLINQIEKQTDYLVVFRNREVDTERTIRVQEKSGKVISYLKNAFEGTDISYEFTNKYILLSKKNHSDAVNDNQQLNRKITGTVKDNNGEPVIGANVSVKGTTNGTITDVDGNFSLENISDNDIIVISYIGYTSQEIKAGKQTSLKIILKEDTQAIDEVVVVGFGTQKKVNLTGSIGTVKTDEVLKSRPVTNVQELLAGSVPGMVVSKGSGAAGSVQVSTYVVLPLSVTVPAFWFSSMVCRVISIH